MSHYFLNAFALNNNNNYYDSITMYILQILNRHIGFVYRFLLVLKRDIFDYSTIRNVNVIYY